MIVTIHPRVANRYPELDPNFPIQAFLANGLPAYQVRGHQLMAAGVHTVKSIGQKVQPDRWYFMSLKDVVKVKYIELSSRAEYLLGYKVPGKMRVIPYDKDNTESQLYYRVLPEDALAAGVPESEVNAVTDAFGYICINKSMTNTVREG